MAKECFKCGKVKAKVDFYKHKQMGDGYLGKCKLCARADVLANYRKNIAYYREYEKKRFKMVKRKRDQAKYQKRWRRKNPEKQSARRAVQYYLSTGAIERKPCKICDKSKTEAHHEDYSKPLDIEWLCFKCHRTYRHNQIIS